MKYHVSPFGITECCICDSPDVSHISPTEDGELLPYCVTHAKDLKERFPEVEVFINGKT